MTVTIKNNESNVTTNIVHSEAGSAVVVTKKEQTLFKYTKKNYDTTILHYLNDRKLLDAVCLN